MSITYTINNEKNGVEVKFTEKPSRKVLEQLKACGFRWSQNKGLWWAKKSAETVALAKKLADEEGEQISLAIADVDDDKDLEEASAKKTGTTKKENPKKAEKSAPKPKAKVEKKAEVKAEPKKAEAPKKDNIVIFPKARPEVKVAITDGEWTYNDCKAKLEYERKIFCDSDSQFVIDGLLKMCEINQNFRNNVMRKDKSYEGAFKYFMEMARKGYALQYNGVTYLDNNIALGFAMDYYNEADVPTNVINGTINKAN